MVTVRVLHSSREDGKEQARITSRVFRIVLLFFVALASQRSLDAAPQRAGSRLRSGTADAATVAITEIDWCCLATSAVSQ